MGEALQAVLDLTLFVKYQGKVLPRDGPYDPNLADVQKDGTQDLSDDAKGPAARTLAQPPAVFQGYLLSCPRPSTFGMID